MRLQTAFRLVNQGSFNVDHATWIVKIGSSCLKMTNKPISMNRLKPIQEVNRKNQEHVLQIDVIALEPR